MEVSKPLKLNHLFVTKLYYDQSYYQSYH